jgi:hypothetical protein
VTGTEPHAWETGLMDTITYVGLDVHKATLCIALAESGRERLTRQIEELLPSWSMAPVVAALQAMRGVALIVAVTVVSEVGDFRRFANARQLMAYLGLVPTEHSSGASVRRGGTTKAGNVLARRALIEELGLTACRHASAASFMTATRSCCRRSATSLGKARSGCVRAIGGLLRRASRRSWSPRQSPVRWSALSGRSPTSRSPRSQPDQTARRQPGKEADASKSNGAHCRR